MTRTRTGTARIVLVPIVLLALAGCQPGQEGPATPAAPDSSAALVSPDDPVSDDDPGAAAAPSDEPAASAEPVAPLVADLTVAVDATGKGAVTTYTLTCDPTGGDHPDAEAACAAIAAGGLAAFAPTPRDVACTEQWGGPQTAKVTGTVGGETVNARFNRTNGCEIARWDALEALLGSGAGGM